MLLPSSPMVLSQSMLDPVDESIWYPDIPALAETRVEADIPFEIEGINVGTVFTVFVVGTVTAIRYYRPDDAMPSSGTVALWQIDNFTDVLKSSVDFSGHSGTGWKTIDLPAPVKVNSAHAYIAHLWLPSFGPDNRTVAYPYTQYVFVNNGYFSEPFGFVYAIAPLGNDDFRGFLNANGPFDPGPFKRPYFLEGSFAGFWVDVVVHGRPKPIPPDPPMILKWDIPEGWPTPDTTGPDPDTDFGTPVFEKVRSAFDGDIIENVHALNGIIIGHNNVTVRNCIAQNHYPSAIYIDFGTTGTVIEDCWIDGYGKNNAGSTGIQIAGSNVLIQRCEITRFQDGSSCYGASFPVNVTMQDNIIHHMRSNPGHPHYDCTQWDGGIGGLLIKHNTFMNEQEDTSTIMLDTYSGSMGTTGPIVIEDNYLCGGGYTLYCDDRFGYPGQYRLVNVHYIRNMLRMGQHGYFFINPPERPELRGTTLLDHGGVYHDSPPPESFSLGDSVPENFLRNPGNDIPGGMWGRTTPAGSGLTVGFGFQAKVAGVITSINFPRPSFTTNIQFKIAVWRYTGSNYTSGAELLASKTFTDRGDLGFRNFAFDTPVEVEAGDNLIAAVFLPRGSDGKCWYFVAPGFFWPNHVPSQWTRLAAYSNNPSMPLNGFQGANPLFNVGPDLAIPTETDPDDSNIFIDPVFVATWTDAGLAPVYGFAANAYVGEFPVVRVFNPRLIEVLLGKVTVTTT